MATEPMWHGAAGSAKGGRRPSGADDRPREFGRVTAYFLRFTGDNAAVLDVADACLSPNHDADEAFLRPQAVCVGCGCGVMLIPNSSSKNSEKVRSEKLRT